MSGYAVKNDFSGWRAVDGPNADPENPEAIFPDDTEHYSEEIPAPPIPSAEEVLAIATAKLSSLLAAAALKVAPLQDAVDLGTATTAETANLKLWKQYRVAVNRVSLQAGWPAEVDWPSDPQEI